MSIKVIMAVEAMSLLSEFDPWRSSLCTCPRKLTFNPYTGCDHACVYCYASSYVSRFAECRPKRNVIRRLVKEAKKLKGEIVSMSNSSDPYPKSEERLSLTRSCLQVLSKCKCMVQIVTKSSLVVRDIDVLKATPSMVSVTITTDKDDIGQILEPGAPLPSARIETACNLVRSGVPTAVRIDPIIPFVNDDVEVLVTKVAHLGVKHLTSSTYKMRPDNWKRFSMAMPETARRLKPLYFEAGERRAGYIYLTPSLRSRLMERVRRAAEKNGLKFGTCREGLDCLNTGTCDGSWLLHKRIDQAHMN